MAFGLLHALKKNVRDRLFQGGTAVSAVIFGLILIAFLCVQFLDFNGLRPYSQPWKVMMLINGFIFSVLLYFWSFRSRNVKNKALLFGIAPLLIFFVVHYTIPDPTIESKSPGVLLEQQKKDITDENIIISDENSASAVCWYLKRSDVYVLGWADELNYGLGYKDANGRLLDMQSAVDLINQNRGKTVLVARVKNIVRWLDQLPKPVFQDQSGPSGYVLWKY